MDGLHGQERQKRACCQDGKNVSKVNDVCVIVKGAIFDWCVRHAEFSLPEYINKLTTKCLEGIF